MQILDIPFRDQRDYLHGTDIYSLITQSLIEELGVQNRAAKINEADVESTSGSSIVALRLKFRRFSQQKPALVWLGEIPSQKNAPVAISVTLKDGSTRRGELRDTEERVTLRIPSVEQKVTMAGVIDAEMGRFDELADINHWTDVRPIDALVFLTKSLHTKTQQLPGKRWIFSALDINRLLIENDIPQLSVSIAAGHNNANTQSEIRVGEELLGHIFFSAV